MTRQSVRSFSPSHVLGSLALMLVGILLASSCVQTWLSTEDLATSFVSPQTWMAVVGSTRRISYSPVVSVVAGMALTSWIAGSLWIVRRAGQSFVVALTKFGFYGSIWWCLIGVWEWLWMGAGIVGWTSLSNVFALTPQIWLALCLSGGITTLTCLAANVAEEGNVTAAVSAGHGVSRCVWLACALYVVIYTTMNWRLYFNLLIPHGDSAMYEEHLWNVLHGKGFRSYLDQGLFLGEHIQFVHLFLIPLYIFWPSHLLLELCESSALALGAFPVFWMACRHSQSDKTALAAAIAYLLYSPMQFLDIEIDLKTFRPEAFGIPLLLLTLDQLERRNLLGFLVGLAMTLTVKEDYAIIFGPLGIWIAASAALTHWQDASSDRNANGGRLKWLIVGLALAVFSVVYLWLATRVVMPWFRSGVEVHYVGYFKKLGKSPEEIVWNIFTKPNLWFDDLFSISTMLFAISMLVPVAFLPVVSRGRLAVGAPLFAILCLSETTRDPRHHFHAPLVAIVFWAVAGGLPQATRLLTQVATWLRFRNESSERTIPILLRTLLWSSSLATGIFFSLGPLGITFWDPGSSWHWNKLYGGSRRAELFVHVPPLIPITSRVASTDFVHPRFTHYERSYDYSAYVRKVSDYKLQVPDDTDFIVIDTQHHYNLTSKNPILRPEDVPEYRDHREQWEVLPDQTQGYFIVLKRK